MSHRACCVILLTNKGSSKLSGCCGWFLLMLELD